MAQNDAPDFYFIIREFPKDFFSNVDVRDQLNFDNTQKWSFETNMNLVRIHVESKLLVLANSYIALNHAEIFYFIIHELTNKFFPQISRSGII